MKKLYHALLVAWMPFVAPLAAQDNFVGQIMFVPYNFSPQGWHNCDGSLLSISENEVLFTLIGTTYGGDGQTTFAVPDMRGRVMIDDGQGNTLSSFTLGQMSGTETMQLTQAQMPAHSHTVNAVSGAGTSESPTSHLPANTGILDKEYSNQPLTSTMKMGMLSAAG